MFIGSRHLRFQLGFAALRLPLHLKLLFQWLVALDSISLIVEELSRLPCVLATDLWSQIYSSDWLTFATFHLGTQKCWELALKKVYLHSTLSFPRFCWGCFVWSKNRIYLHSDCIWTPSLHCICRYFAPAPFTLQMGGLWRSILRRKFLQ